MREQEKEKGKRKKERGRMGGREFLRETSLTICLLPPGNQAIFSIIKSYIACYYN